MTFQLPEEMGDHLRALHGSEAFSTLWEIDGRLRNLVKHGEIEDISARELAEEIRRTIGETLLRAEP